MFVVTSMQGDAKGDNAVGERTPLVAFRRSKTPQLVFTSALSRAIGIFLGPVFVVTALFARAAVRAHRRGRQGPTRAGVYAGVSILIGVLAFLLVCIGSVVWWIVSVWLAA